MAKRFIIAAFLLAAVSAAGVAGEGEALRPWEPVGPGGGGGNFRCAVSPYDTELYFSACDMGGFYRSADAGANWRMIDGIGHTTMAVVFDPVDPEVCYVGHTIGSFLNNGWALSKSTDSGETWRRLYGIIGAYDTNSPTCLVVDPADPDCMFLGTRGNLPGRILKSVNGGHSWEASDAGIPAGANIMALYMDGRGEPGGRTLWAITPEGPYVSSDGARTWVHGGASGLGEGEQVEASAAIENDEGALVVYVASETRISLGIQSGDAAGNPVTWKQTGSPVSQLSKESGGARGGRMTAIAAADDGTLYAAAHMNGEPYRSGIWKSADGGASWKFVLPGKALEDIQGPKRGEGSGVETAWLTREFGWGWGGPPNNADQLYVCASDSDIVLRQDDGRTMGTRDGGETWQQLYSDHVEGNRWTSRGYEVTTCYRVYFDPRDADKMFIAYTDIGFFRSEDGGDSWIYALRGSRHTNTVYQAVIDPDKPDVMWAAVSSHHDMPYWKTLVPDRYNSRGGVSMTTDGAKSWKPMGEDGGLPNSSVGAILLDPKSPVDSRTLYVTSWGRGVYKSTDGGKTWAEKNNGIDTERDFNFWRMSMAADGTLYVITTKVIEVTDGVYKFGSGALYRSDDGAESWKLLLRGGWMAYPWDVVCDPVDAKVVYVAAKADPHVEAGTVTPGGLYRSSDGGKTWERLLAKQGVQRLTIDPADTDVIYVSTDDEAVYRSSDGAKVWNHLEGIPFKNCVGISIDPSDRETIYVTTFGGGVWKGSAYGSGFEPESGFGIDIGP